MGNVAVICTDGHYIEHASSLVAGLRGIGKWEGDIVVITTSKDEAQLGILDRHVILRCVPEDTHPFFMKQDMLDPWYRRWDNILYLDCDCMVMRPLILEDFCPDPKDIRLVADFTEYTLLHSITGLIKSPTPEQTGLIRQLEMEMPLTRHCFSAGCMVLGTDYIEWSGMKQRFEELRKTYAPINYHIRGVPDGSEEPIWNLASYRDSVQVRDHAISYWGRNAGTASILHFCHYDAPWSNNNRSAVFGCSYRERYLANLREFKEW